MKSEYLTPTPQEGSPGKVTFSHGKHLSFQNNIDCRFCHSGAFKILKDGKRDLSSVTMNAMYEGKSCGMCHDGKAAFSASEKCDACHQ